MQCLLYSSVSHRMPAASYAVFCLSHPPPHPPSWLGEGRLEVTICLHIDVETAHGQNMFQGLWMVLIQSVTPFKEDKWSPLKWIKGSIIDLIFSNWVNKRVVVFFMSAFQPTEGKNFLSHFFMSWTFNHKGNWTLNLLIRTQMLCHSLGHVVRYCWCFLFLCSNLNC